MNIIYVFIGPKGSGKSYVGRLLEEEFGIRFLAIENIFIKLQGKGISSPDVQKRGYKIVEDRITEILTQAHAASFELTVFTPASKELVNRLGLLAQIEMVQITAPLEICLERIKTRDRTSHIEISEEKIATINELSVAQSIKTKLQIDTSEMSDEEIVERFRVVYNR